MREQLSVRANAHQKTQEARGKAESAFETARSRAESVELTLIHLYVRRDAKRLHGKNLAGVNE